jgi:hypothetical protein
MAPLFTVHVENLYKETYEYLMQIWTASGLKPVDRKPTVPYHAADPDTARSVNLFLIQMSHLMYAVDFENMSLEQAMHVQDTVAQFAKRFQPHDSVIIKTVAMA